MKKKVISLAIFTAAVSGSVIAADWDASGSGGTVELGGTVTVKAVNSPWMVKTGSAVNNLDAKIESDGRSATVILGTDISVLSIRNEALFTGKSGISPQINYGNAVQVDSFNNGYAPLTLEVKNSEGEKIGTASTSLFAVGIVSYTGRSATDRSLQSMYSPSEGYGFWGGLGKTSSSAADYASYPFSFVTEAAEYYTTQGVSGPGKKGGTKFSYTSAKYSSYYASGIEKSKSIVITLDKPATSDAITWKASLPVTVSYA